jgi:hypothetical protein
MPHGFHRRPLRPALGRAIVRTPLLAAIALTACTTVKPSQRGLLAKPEMDPSTDALEESFHSHVDTAREGSMGGHGASGGGCGCG